MDDRPRIRLLHLSPWAGPLTEAEAFLAAEPGRDLSGQVGDPNDPELLRMARLDCDWHAENVRAFAAVAHPELHFLPAWTFGPAGGGALLARAIPEDETWWLVVCAQHPQLFGDKAGRFFGACARRGIRILYYAFDEASRTMPCFPAIAPFLDVLVHDEGPLGTVGRAALRPQCVTLHRSWVANVVPFAAPFADAPEAKILFLGSKMGLTPHRQRQIDFLAQRYGDRFVCHADHSVPVAGRNGLNRYAAALCPEGRKFAVPTMGATHTDRPFWSGCLGMVPVSEDSAGGGRLEDLHRKGLICRYRHGDLASLAEQCDRALATPTFARRRIYEHFNRYETVGTVVAEQIAAAGSHAGRSSSSGARQVPFKDAPLCAVG